MSAPSRTFTVRNVQLLRALFAAVAALMITFSSDHSAAVGLSVFSGFAIATALVMLLSVWLVFPAGSRWPAVVIGLLSVAAGMATGIPVWRTNDVFFIVVGAWALATGLTELLAGIRARRIGTDPTARDSIIIGSFGILLAVLLWVIPAGFTHDYTIEEAGTFELTGIILGVGMLGGYAALVAVFLGIAGLTPQKADAVAPASVPAESGDAR